MFHCTKLIFRIRMKYKSGEKNIKFENLFKFPACPGQLYFSCFNDRFYFHKYIFFMQNVINAML
jgi:hypothetical protein